MGDLTGRRGFSPEMHGLRASDYDCQTAGGEEYTGLTESGGIRAIRKIPSDGILFQVCMENKAKMHGIMFLSIILCIFYLEIICMEERAAMNRVATGKFTVEMQKSGKKVWKSAFRCTIISL